jgi:hypothetical protein
MAMGTSVLQIRIELIFRRCWNLITPWRSARGFPANVGRVANLGPRIHRREPPALDGLQTGEKRNSLLRRARQMI